MEYNIRPMAEKDITQVQRVAETSWHTTYKGLIPQAVQDHFLTEAYSAKMLQRRMKFSYILVVEVDNQVIGFVNYSPVTEGKVELGAIYLLPDYQGKGIGTALLARGIEMFPEAKVIYINVERDNEIAKPFYYAKGFKEVEVFNEDFDGHQLQTIRMALNL
ncbi:MULTISPECIES: GNAT family N-acetyltransferase [Virgibacillus]|uniref:N-acetyltransferase n=2 Tax=Virgibacillus TaxID=84406 RepID=A0ABQ2DTK7_9BACI|nr:MULTISPECIES: GNAT family N-acetyltransferase [Virgibacillus]EQB34933.1 hypothetical protein M948_17645 [Virgibacillus sp. CM-4]MYL42947.1 GNAT family N-acetyltransferase [Virgibacillus massiliensis]GGJ70882.1 N-acetyltransferase [Virgibacillus kapii]CDQ40849.1 putative acetyltransferase [Virgibacillus massiliensis]